MATEHRMIHLSAGGVSLVLAFDGDRLPRVVHWGADLGIVSEDELIQLDRARTVQPFGTPVDGGMAVSVLPEASAGWPGVRGVEGHRAGASPSVRFVVTATQLDDRPTPWAQGVVVSGQDVAAGLDLRLEIEQSESGLIRIRAAVTASPGTSAEISTRAVDIDVSAVYDIAGVLPVLPVPAHATELLDFTGHQLRERSPQRLPFVHGTHERTGHRGRPGFDTGYLLCAGESGFGARSGEVWAVHSAWSGNQRMLAERNYHGIALLGAGEALEPGEVRLKPGETYTSPWMYATYGNGLDAATARIHEWLRARAHHPGTPRPVIVNTWEAVTFDHSLDRLLTLADAAAEVGAERFVLDDGWFGARRGSTAGLGDWVVSPEVYPKGLWPLVDHVRERGMEFGLWVEPEMVNLDSDLARAHPEWILTAGGGRMLGAARNQQLLNLSDPGAYAHVLNQLDALLNEYPIGYLKWDHNRELGEGGLPPSGRSAARAQTEAVYRLIDALRLRHPGLEIETCASGGGRVDLEILERTDRVWGSDSTDAHERLDLQRWTNLLVPYEMLGAHISSPVAPTSGRALPLDFRCAIALFGHMGIEWDLTEASSSERARLAEWVAYYKRRRRLLHSGTVVHADVPDPSYRLHGVVDEEQNEALYAWVCTASSTVWPPPPVALPGIDPDRHYRVALDGPITAVDGIATHWGAPLEWLMSGGVELPGRMLTSAGIALPELFADRAVIIRAIAIDY
ncbi:alpha-galactosidase [Microbacterium telephonicum]|uniref:alpha-galactosidase n=2 Tax=Microbacterium telephonicum TaxID=1714841 RepID=A0A498BU11_9MICO|nr:alpha-galactosidase [Microbacterium telephonicum]